MPKRKPSNLDTTTVAGRVAWYLNKIWRGSATAMAKDVRLSPSSIGNVIHGRRSPGREIITAIGAHPLVNSEWLLHGIGTPMDSDDQVGEFGLPIAARPFNGTPADNPDALEEALFPVSRRLYRASRYWMRIPAAHPFVHDAKLKIAAGDMLLFEPDTHRWPGDLAGFPCIASLADDDTLLFGRCLSAKATTVAEVQLYGNPGGTHTDDEYGKQYRHVQIGGSQETAPVHIAAVGVYRCGPAA